MRIKTFLIATVVALGGCASGPQEFAKLTPAPGGRVGMVNLLEPEVTNVHLSATVFGNFNNRLQNDWNLNNFAQKVASKYLEEAHYQVVNLRLDDKILRDLQDRDDQTSQNYNGLNKGWVDKYRAILRENNLSAVVVLRDETRNAAPNGGLPFHGYGLMSFFISGPVNPDKKPMIFVTAYADVIGGEPPHRSTGCAIHTDVKVSRSDIQAAQAAPLIDRAQIPVDDLADIKISDIAWLKPRFEGILEQRIQGNLSSSGLISGQAPCSTATTR